MTAATPSTLGDVAAYLDDLLRTSEIPDYRGAMNGIQVEHVGPVTRCAVAVDASSRTIEGAIEQGANLLIVHHGLFWGGVQPIRGHVFERVRRLITHDVAVYASHLPLDLHPTVGNNVLLARELGLTPESGFARFESIEVGVKGTCDLATGVLARRCEQISRREGGQLVAVGVTPERRTTRWAICTGAGASSESLREAKAAQVDTLIVGEGPHHTAIEAEEFGIAALYVGHYASETFGVRALGAEIERMFGIPWSFIAAPTGL
jgi:dinuclear metal center YbgI/SA1388 family protein